jgi:serine/threonine protein kinase
MIPSSDSRGLAGLMQLTIESELQPRVRYRLERRIGEGALGIAFLALRDAPEGTSPVVIKAIKPQIVVGMGATASLIVRKEAVALGRLNETVPPTPFVVRFIDTGTAPLYGTAHPSLPWIAVEYVHGGVEGTTLEERLQHSKDTTGFAFDPVRAAHLVRRTTCSAADSARRRFSRSPTSASPARAVCR